MSCASYKLALEGLVSEAFELWNKDPIVMLLTLGHGGCVEAFPLVLLGQQSQRHPCPPGTRLAHWEPGLCLCRLLALVLPVLCNLIGLKRDVCGRQSSISK